MIAVYPTFWTASLDVVQQKGEPLFYVENNYDLDRMFAIDPRWRVKETRIRAIANLPNLPVGGNDSCTLQVTK